MTRTTLPQTLWFSQLAALGLLAAACHPPWHPIPTFDDETTGSESEGSGASGSASASGTTGSTSSDPTQGTDGDDPTEGTGEPAIPPEILEVMLTPQPMLYQGPIAVEVQTTLGATGVSLLLGDGGVAQELAVDAGDPAHFHGVIPAISGAMNGEHLALLTPWAVIDDGETIAGDTVEVPYTLALPEPGSGLFWESGDMIGQGEVAALDHLTSGEVVEFGSLTGGSGCYLRRRSKGGAWTMSDYKVILGGVDCEALDMVITPNDEIVILGRQTTDQGVRWWLAKQTSWGAILENVALGWLEEDAQALALHDSGMVAVCGSVPTGKPDGKDAAAWLFRPDLPGETWSFDYQPMIANPNAFSETTRDCAFSGDTLVMVGEASGHHDNQNILVERRLSLLEFDSVSKASAWTVAGGQLHPQSIATAITIDELGRYYVGGYTCGKDCNNQPMADLRVYSPGGTQVWITQIGTMPNPGWAPRALAWSPAGYAVLALGGSKGEEFAFSVRAYATEQTDPLWIYTRNDSPFLSFARAVSVGAFGEIVAGGVGMTGYPAIAYIAG